MRSNIAAEARAQIIYERLINLTPDPGVRDALGFSRRARSRTRYEGCTAGRVMEVSI
jgi:Mn-containing catalase